MSSELSVYRRLGAALFDEVCDRSGLPATGIATLLRAELRRDHMSRQTIASWRSGDGAVPSDAYLAVARASGLWMQEVMAAVIARDPALMEAMPRRPLDEAAQLARAAMFNALLTSRARQESLGLGESLGQGS